MGAVRAQQFFVICALVASMGYAAPLRKPEVAGLAT
jgi:hypothetical protein